MIRMHADLELLAGQTIRKLRRTEYDALIEQGSFEGERIELIHGMLVEMSPIGASHALTCDAIARLLYGALIERAHIRVGNPLPADEWSEPEPDFSVAERKAYTHHPEPADTYLVIEVSSSSLRKDRTIKGPLYAAAGIPEYWIVNVDERRVEIHTNPVDGDYRQVTVAAPGDHVSPEAFPHVRFAVDEMIQPPVAA